MPPPSDRFASSSTGAAISPPRGFRASHLTFQDTFGGAGYDLLDNWNFGFASKRHRQEDGSWSWGSWVGADGQLHYQPWWMSGTPPYQTSYTRDDHDPAHPELEKQYKAECAVPQMVSQTVGDGTYRRFDPTGRGLRITARKVSNPNCEGKTWESATINTFGKRWFGGPRTEYHVEVRARMPHVVHNGRRVTNGAWAGFWLLPAHDNPDSMRGDAFEVDILESGFKHGSVPEMAVLSHNLHRDGSEEEFHQTDAGVDLSQGYHRYGVTVNTRTREVTYYFDDTVVGGSRHHHWQGPVGSMFLLLTLHVAGPDADWQHQPVDDTARMHLDVARVRVYERKLNQGASKARLRSRVLDARYKRRFARARLVCTDGAADCRGRLRIMKSGTRLGSARYAMRPGTTKRVRVRLNYRARRILRRHPRIRARAIVHRVGAANARKRVSLTR